MPLDLGSFPLTSKGPIFPAAITDAGNIYTATASALFQMGTLFTLPSGFDPNTLGTIGARAIAETLKVYGAYLIDATTGGFNILAEGNFTEYFSLLSQTTLRAIPIVCCRIGVVWSMRTIPTVARSSLTRPAAPPPFAMRSAC